MTCIREGDEVTLKACKCKTGSVGLVDLRFRSVLLLTAFRCCLFQSSQPLQTNGAVGGNRWLQGGGGFEGALPLSGPTGWGGADGGRRGGGGLQGSCPFTASPLPFLHLPQQHLQSTCMHSALCTYKCLTYTLLLPKQNSKHPKVYPCRSTLHAVLPGICHASVYQHS